MSLVVGQTVTIPSSSNQTGTLRYLGETHFRPGIWAGIELHQIGTGKNNGTIDDIQYFECSSPNTGLFVLASKVKSVSSIPVRHHHRGGSIATTSASINRRTSLLLTRPAFPNTTTTSSLQPIPNRSSTRHLSFTGLSFDTLTRAGISNQPSSRRNSGTGAGGPKSRPLSFQSSLIRPITKPLVNLDMHQDLFQSPQPTPMQTSQFPSPHPQPNGPQSSIRLNPPSISTYNREIPISPAVSSTSPLHLSQRDSGVLCAPSPTEYNTQSNPPNKSSSSSQNWSSISNSNNQVKTLKDTVDSLNYELERRNKTISEQDQLITKLQAKLATQNQLTSEIDDIQLTISQIETESLVKDRSVEGQLKLLQQQLDSTVASLANTESVNTHLQSTVQTQLAKIRVLQDEHEAFNKGHNQVLDQLHADIKAKSDRITNLQLTVDEYHAKSVAADLLVSELRLAEQSSSHEINRLSTLVKSIEDRARLEQARVVSDMQREMELLHTEKCESTSSLVLQHSAIKKDLESKTQLITQLQTDQQQLHDKIAHLELQTQTQAQQIQLAESQNGTQSALLLKTENELMDARKQIGLMGISLKSRTDLEQQMQEMESHFATEMDRALQIPKMQVSKLETQVLDKQREVELAHQTLVCVQDELVSTKTQMKTQQVTIQELQQEKQQIQQETAASQTRVNQLTDQIQSLRAAHEVLEKEYEQVLTGQLEQGTLRRGKLVGYESRIKELQAVIHDQEEMHSSSKLTIHRLKTSVLELQTSLDASELKVKELANQLKVATEGLAEKEAEALAFKNKVRELKLDRRETMSSYMGTIDTLMADMMTLQSKYDLITTTTNADSKRDSIQSNPGLESSSTTAVITSGGGSSTSTSSSSTSSTYSSVNNSPISSHGASVTFPIDYKLNSYSSTRLKRSRRLVSNADLAKDRHTIDETTTTTTEE